MSRLRSAGFNVADCRRGDFVCTLVFTPQRRILGQDDWRLFWLCRLLRRKLFRKAECRHDSWTHSCDQGITNADGVAYLEPEDWMVAGSNRFFKAFRDFESSKNIPFRSPPEIYAKNYVNTFDVSVTYALTKRLSVTLGLPSRYRTRSTYLEPDGVSRHTTYVAANSLTKNTDILPIADCGAAHFRALGH